MLALGNAETAARRNRLGTEMVPNQGQLADKDSAAVLFREDESYSCPFVSARAALQLCSRGIDESERSGCSNSIQFQMTDARTRWCAKGERE